nr:T9SS type A sorting domain-containing protein [Fodinibius sp.]NIW44254.1 T9SS type A sorting domain-containing protein [Gammaproteobacteria bacterium]NIX01512.1 T9SS type A sorting domain-containing protein [Phycisphaerae bacterium]NIY26038.1 T9SS type A sorting domain-containing protein [Fodinibius sp.]
YQLPKSSQVKLTVYNTLGQEVHTLVNERQPAGQQSVIWDGTDQHGKQVSSGFYIYQIKAGEYVRNRRMLLIR